MSADLTIAFDPGSTSGRAFYTLKPYNPELLVMDPEIAKVSQGRIEGYKASYLGSRVPENDAWVEYKGQCRAVGFLARHDFHADLNTEDSKLKLAMWKTLALIGAIAQNKELSNGVKIYLGLLLPYREYEDRKLFESLIAEAIGGYCFRGEKRSFELDKFVCRPEGFGLVSRGRPPGRSLRDRVIVVIVVGYRDASVYTMNRGAISQGKSERMGFKLLIDTVQSQTSDLDPHELIAAVSKAGPKVSVKALQTLARDLDFVSPEIEVSQIRSAVLMAREQYWLTLSEWIGRNTPSHIDEVIVGGGTAYYYRREFDALFSQAKPNWCDHLEEQVNRHFLPQISTYSLRYRVLDDYGYFHYLCGASERSFAYAQTN